MISEPLLLVGTVIFILTWLLPAFEHRLKLFRTTSVTVHQGWEAFCLALPPESFSFGSVLNTLSALTNFLLAATIVAATTFASHSPPIAIQITLTACGLLNLNWWFRVDQGRLRIGYYWWACAFFVIGAALGPRHGATARWSSPEGVVQSALFLVTINLFVAGTLVEWWRISADTMARREMARDSGVSSAEVPQMPTGGHDESQGKTARTGSSWFLVGGVLVACLTWLVLALAPKTSSVDHPAPMAPPPRLMPHRSSSIPAHGLSTTGSESLPRQTPTKSAGDAQSAATALNEASRVVLALRQQAHDLRRNLEPLLNDPTLRAEALDAEKSLEQGEDLLRGGDAQSAAALLHDAASKLEIARASAERILGLRRLADENARNAVTARQRVTRNQALEYAESSFSRGAQLEAQAEIAYRSRDYRSASTLYASASQEYDNSVETIRQGEQARATREQQAREDALRLQDEQARELAKRQAEERDARLREQNALRAHATGKIHTVHLNYVTYGGGNSPEIEILVDFTVNGMKGLDGEVVVFLFSQATGLFDHGKGPLGRLKGTGSDSNGVYANAKYTPPYDSSQYSGLRLAIRTSRFTLPKGSHRILAFVYLRTGGAGTLVRDLDGESKDILLNEP